MNVLYDTQEDEPVALVDPSVSLRSAVELYLKKEGYWNGPYYGDGRQNLTGAQFITKRALVEEAFKLFKGLPVLK